MTTQQFPFRIDGRYRLPLGLLGVRAANSWVRVGGGELVARFGPWRLRTPLSTVRTASVTGPFSALRAIGVRLSLGDRGLTFGSSTEAGACLEFHEPVHLSGPLGVLAHPSITVTVREPARLVEAVQQRAMGPDV